MKERAKFVLRQRRFWEEYSDFLKKCRGAFCRTFFEKKVLHSKKLTEKEMWCKKSLISQICPEKWRIFIISCLEFLGRFFQKATVFSLTNPARSDSSARGHRCALHALVLPAKRIHPHRGRRPYPWENRRAADSRSFRKRKRWEDNGRRFRR